MINQLKQALNQFIGLPNTKQNREQIQENINQMLAQTRSTFPKGSFPTPNDIYVSLVDKHIPTISFEESNGNRYVLTKHNSSNDITNNAIMVNDKLLHLNCYYDNADAKLLWEKLQSVDFKPLYKVVNEEVIQFF